MKIIRGVALQPRSLFTVKSLIDFQICHAHEIKIVKTEITKIGNQTKVWMLNVNLGQILQMTMTQSEEILKNSKTRPLG